LFLNNAKARKADRMSDPALCRFLREEFGNKHYFRNVSNLRAMYNRGVLTKGKPKRRSLRYGEDGSVMPAHARN